MAEMKFSTSSSDTKEFNGKKAGKIAVIAVIAVAPVSYTHLTLPTN